MAKGFNELDEVEAVKNANNILLVDGLNFAFRFKHKKQRNFAADYLRAINSFANSFRADKVFVHADWGSSTYRKGLYPEYKGNRKALYADQSAEEEAEFLQFMDDFNSALELCATCHPVVKFKGVEADDTITYITLNADVTTEHIHILSTDRDFDQLICENVSRFSYGSRKEVNIGNFFENYGCTPEEYISVKVLQGDPGDNVPGVVLVGPKRAAGIVRQYGSAFDIYDNLPLPGKQKFIQNINGFGEQILLNYELMDLGYCEDGIGPENVEVLKKIMEVHGL